MRPGQQNKRGRGRNGGGGGGGGNGGGGGGGGNFNRKGANPLTRSYDSSGPDVKIRGTAQHIAEKYSALARDAQSSGDRVMAENYLQHAEHYNRIIAAAQAQMQDRVQRDDRNDFERDGADSDDIDGNDDQPVIQHQRPVPQQQYEVAGSGPQPVIEQQAQPVAEAAEEGEQPETAEAQDKGPRRRNAQRPRRQPRRAEGEEGAAPREKAPKSKASSEQPALAESE